MPSRFVHLRLHTEYSMIDGILRIEPLMEAVVDRQMNAVALTDFCNLFAAVKVYKAAIAEGVKPILGADLQCHFSEKPSELSTVVLLCQNDLGYKNLTRLISKAYQEGQIQNEPRVQYEWLSSYSEGLIALSGGRTGALGRALIAGDRPLALSLAQFFSNLFPGRFYLEIQRTGRPDESLYNEQVISLAQELQLPLVATNDVRFLDKEDFDAHEARVCINQGHTLADPRRSKAYSAAQYLRSADEMVALFRDLPEALENSVIIAQRCTVKLELGHNYLPKFPIPDHSDEDLFLRKLSAAGLASRLQMIFQDKQNPDGLAHLYLPYEERLQFELDVIIKMGFSGYFLIVADFIKWARENGVAVGPGRGSGAGSLVAYALEITDLDPLQYELLFERFLNPERVSMPDFDIDFCMEGRDRVIDYVAEKYGRNSVSQIITFGTMAAKAVVRDVGRVLGHPYGFVDTLAKLIPFELGITLSKALEDEPILAQRYQEEEEVKELIDLALKLEGITRNAGKHAGGVVIAPSALTDFTAIYCEQDSTQIVSQFDKDDVELVGLVKFDFLGLRTLTIIDWALKIIKDVDISRIPMDDPKTFDLLKACQTTAVFQLESRGMKELIHRLQPDCFEEIIALVALFRPGPLQSGMVDDFIDRKHGRAKVVYPHPDLEPILKPTYGVILYQEQVMQIAQVLGNYTLGAADLLRRAMGKKKPEEMAEQRTIFTQGAVSRGVAEEVATHIFDLMEKFAGYGFNKSHSAAYALVAYQTAWLKAHYPAAFMAAVMSSDMDNTDKVVIFINECKQMKLRLLPPSINQSNCLFTVLDDKTIIYGLGAIKGVGEAAIGCIVSEREQGGNFLSLFDFCRRLDLRKVNKRVLEALIRAGSMDEWQIERAVLFASIDKAQQCAERAQKNQQSGQGDLFECFSEEDGGGQEEHVMSKTWSHLERLDGEKKTLGLYISGHPAAEYQRELQKYTYPINGLQRAPAKKALLCAWLISQRSIMTKTGKKLTILHLEDGEGSIDVVVYSEIYEARTEPLQVGQACVIEGEVGLDNYSGGLKMTAKQLYSISDARTHFSKGLLLQVDAAQDRLIENLKNIFAIHKGPCKVQLQYSNGSVQVRLQLAEEWGIEPSDEVLDMLRNVLGLDRVCLIDL